MTKAKVTFPSAPDTSAIDIEDEGSLIVSNPTAMNFTGPGVTVTENPTGTAEVDIPGLQYWTESEDAAVQQSTIFTPNNAATDVNAVLLPKGTGANTAQTPDGTTAGGNARGQYATDWQKVRSLASQVASGENSVVCGGERNGASGKNSFVGGGENNAATQQKASVIGGANNRSTGNNGAISGGTSSTASGNGSMAFGLIATASGFRSFATGAGISSSSNASSFGLGTARMIGSMANASNNRNFQYISLTSYANGDFTTGSSAYLGIQGGQFVGQPFSDISILNNGFWNVKCFWIAVVETISGTATGVSVGNFMTQCQLFGMKKIGGATATLTSVTNVATHGDVSITGSATMVHSVGGANYLTPTFTAPTFAGGGTLTMRVQAQFDIVETIF